MWLFGAPGMGFGEIMSADINDLNELLANQMSG